MRLLDELVLELSIKLEYWKIVLVRELKDKLRWY